MSSYYLGAPVWACDSWVGSLYSSGNRRRWLAEYSSVFNTVEGNSTFYGVPDEETFRRWAAETADGFRFCLKFPSAITHERELLDADRETDEFISRLRILQQANRLGPSLLQLPPFFTGDQLPSLEKYLRSLPRDLPVAVEVRHLDYFDAGRHERPLNALLKELQIDRALFDSRALYSQPPRTEAERISQTRKPRSPHRTTVTAARPMVRFIGRDDMAAIETFIAEWADTVAGWIRQGLTPYVFTHAPDDAISPVFAQRFHAAMLERVSDLPALPDWPGRTAPRQQSLF